MREAGIISSAITATLLFSSFFAYPALGAGLSRSVKGNGFLSIPVHESRRNTTGLDKRDTDTIEAVLTNQQFFYTMDIEIGTPGQLITVLLDTGSSDLWVNPNCSNALSASQKSQCTSFGHYDPGASTTPAEGPLGHKTIRFGDPSDPNTQSKVEIDYYADDIALFTSSSADRDANPPAVILNQTFGVVVESHGQAQGILGLAPDLNAGFDGKQTEQPYSLLLNSLVEQGLIAKRAFSLDLRHAEASEGAVIYGGLDRGKFIGDLAPASLVDGIRGEPRLALKLAAVTTTVPGSDPDHHPLPDGSRNAMLDSGTTLSRLHANAANSIFRLLGARSLASGYWLAPCALRQTPIGSGSVDFDFGNKTLRVPLSDFILDLSPFPAAEDTNTDDDWCYVGLVLTSDQQVLGDSILRAGYFVFDWDDRVVHIAQASNCDDKIIPIRPEDDISAITGLCEAAWAEEEVDDEEDDGSPVNGQEDSGGRQSRTVTTLASPTDHQNNSAAGTDTAETSAPSSDLSASGGDDDSPANSLLSRWRGGGWVGTRHVSWILASSTAFTLAL